MRLFSFLSLITLVLTGCNEPQDKKTQLDEYKKELKELNTRIETLEAEIAAEDPDYANQNVKNTLVTVIPLSEQKFSHFVEVSGSVESDKNILLSAEIMGTITKIYAREGDRVHKGDPLIKIDDATLQTNLAELKTGLELAETIYERQSNLWKQKIGTEIQYLEAKNRKESLERQLATLKAQIAKALIKAPFSGTVDYLSAKEGEIAQPGAPLIRVVSFKDMFLKADISEAYIGKFKKNDSVIVEYPSLGESIVSKISAVGQVINPQNRTFSVQVKLPSDNQLIKPNLTAILKIKDFESNAAIGVPANLIQKDSKGDFVFIAQEENQGALISKKVHIERGMTYKGVTMVVSGLTDGDSLINEGFKEVIDGGRIKVVEEVI